MIFSKDASDVVELMKVSLLDIYADETGALDFGRAQSGMSNNKRNKLFMAAAVKESHARMNSLFTKQDLVQIASRVGIQGGDFHDMISALNHHGLLIKKGQGSWQVMD